MVGFHATRRLLARGPHVVAAVRRATSTERLRALAPADRLTVVTLDLDDAGSLARAVHACDAVVHCLGIVDPAAPAEELDRVNVQGTRAVLEAAVTAGVRQFVHVSSLSVITAQEDQFEVDEDAPLRLCGEPYADSKVEAEKVVRETAMGATAFTILRPGFIYGPSERAWLPRLIALLQSGRAVLVDGGSKQTNCIYVENLCAAVDACLGHAPALGQVYNLTDGATPTKKELFDTLCDGLGLPRVVTSIPSHVAQAVMAPAAFRLMGLNQGFSVARAERDLGYVHRIPFAEGMTTTLASFRPSPVDAVTNSAG